MNIPNMFPPGKASAPMIDHNTAHIKTTISPRVNTRPKNRLGGIVTPASTSRFFNFPGLDFAGVSPFFVFSLYSVTVLGSIIHYLVEKILKRPAVLLQPVGYFTSGVPALSQFSPQNNNKCHRTPTHITFKECQLPVLLASHFDPFPVWQ